MELKLGQNLRTILKERRLTLKTLSLETGIAMSTLSQWTANREPRKITQVAKLADHLGFSLQEILFGSIETSVSERLNQILKQDLFSGTFEISIKKIHLKE